MDLRDGVTNAPEILIYRIRQRDSRGPSRVGKTMASRVYRSLLKALKIHVTKETGNPKFREFVGAEFRKHKDLSDPAVIKEKLSLAKDYTTLVTSVHYHKVRTSQWLPTI